MKKFRRRFWSNGGITPDPDLSNVQLNFNGVDQELDGGSSVLDVGTGAPFSIIATVLARSAGDTSNGCIVSKDKRGVSAKGHFQIHIDNVESGKLVGYVIDGNSDGYAGAKSDGVFPMDTWVRVALVYSGGTSAAKLYLDGVEQTTSYASGVFDGTTDTTAPFRIGSMYGTTDGERFWDGPIREVWAWNVALSAAEIAELHSTWDPSPLSNHGNYTSSGNLIHGYGLKKLTKLDLSATIPDEVGSADLTPLEFNNVKFVRAQSRKLSAGTGILSGNNAFSLVFDFFLTNDSGGGDALLAMDDRVTPNETFQIQSGGDNVNAYAYAWDQANGHYKGKSGDYGGPGSWVKGALTYDGAGDVKFYIDGVEQTTNFASGGFISISNTSAEFLFGAAKVSGAFDRFLNGKMRWVGVWSTVLSTAEITTLHGSDFVNFQVNTGSYSSSASLSHFWKLILGYNDLTVAGGLPDSVGIKHLTASNFSSSTIIDWVSP